MARGNVTHYRITCDCWDHREHFPLVAAPPHDYVLRRLSAAREYRVTVEARTLKGFNETLRLSIVHIPSKANSTNCCGELATCLTSLIDLFV